MTVLVNGDTLDEDNETFFVNLTNPSNATIDDAQGVATIIDDDGDPSLTINDVSVTEGNSGTVDATFTVTLAPVSGRTVTVDYATADGTASAPDDHCVHRRHVPARRIDDPRANLRRPGRRRHALRVERDLPWSTSRTR